MIFYISLERTLILTSEMFFMEANKRVLYQSGEVLFLQLILDREV